MIFETIKAERFGCLRDWQTPHLDEGLVVIFGLNESGKTTIFNLMTTILYGFSPASRDNNPYVPWDESKAFCQARIKTSYGKRLDVIRRLQSVASGTIISDDKSVDISNKSLEYVRGLPRKVFEQVYTLDIDNMCMPKSKTWEMMQDQLLGGEFCSFIRPVVDVLSELEQQANTLWRSDRRGKPESKMICKQLDGLMEQKSVALENERKIRADQKELDHLEQKLEKMYEQKDYIISYIDKYERLNPAFRKLERIDSLLSESDGIQEFDGVPDDAKSYIKQLDDTINDIIKSKEQCDFRLRQLKQEAEVFSNQHRRILDREHEIMTLIRSYEQIKYYLNEKNRLEVETAKTESLLMDKASETLVGGWKQGLEEDIEGVDMAQLKSFVSLYRKLDEQYQHQKLQSMQRLEKKELTPWISFVILLSGFVGLIISPQHSLDFLFALVMLLGATSYTGWIFLKRRRFNKSPEKMMQDQLCKIEDKKSQLLSKIKRELKDIPIESQRLEYPDENIIMDVSVLKNLISRYTDMRNSIQEIEGRLGHYSISISNLYDQFHIGDTTGDMLKDIDFLEQNLQQARKYYRLVHDARIEIDEMGREIGKLDEQLKETQQAKKALLNCINKMKGIDIEDKIDNILSRRKCRQQAYMLIQELEGEYDDLQDIKELYQHKKDVFIDQRRIEKCKIDREKIEQEINHINNRIGTLKKEIEHGLQNKTLDEIEGEISHLKDRLDDVTFQRDRFILAKNIIIEAQKRFREEHQPDVLKKSGKYIELITGGRYDRIYAQDASSKQGLQVRLCQNDRILEVGEKNLSRGTLEQIYFALRLAMAEHLDPEGESLPVILDDVFVNWDEVRAENGVKLLDALSNSRQVFLITCHEWLLNMLSSAMDVQVIRL
ncbi:MAG: AAA family ATPase [Clostridia bacterium]|nr:AAA family ATPase [Clostridia bacterium]